ncbi:hypothetical protein LX36DRAFT_694949 [Colletotrichum falcatum]|nr:hypothetical protein LX36DRAFT_694949 [Colletotrichum falcatum]
MARGGRRRGPEFQVVAAQRSQNQKSSFDRNGDVLLILHSPNASFAVWNVDKGTESSAPKRTTSTKRMKKKMKKKSGWRDSSLYIAMASDSTSTDALSWCRNESQQVPEAEPPAPPRPDPPAEPEKEPAESEKEPAGSGRDSEIKYLVSSRHLALASTKFEAEFKEWDPEALLILMRVIHGQTRSVPRQIDLEILAKIAVLVDYYDSLEVVEVFASIWIGVLKNKLPTQYGRDMIAVTQSTEPVPTLELPIPSIVIDLVDWQRQDAVDFVLKTLQTLLESFRKGSSGCSFECSSILLGALTKEMDRHRLLNPAPKEPYTGYSILETEKVTLSQKRSSKTENKKGKA